MNSTSGSPIASSRMPARPEGPWVLATPPCARSPPPWSGTGAPGFSTSPVPAHWPKKAAAVEGSPKWNRALRAWAAKEGVCVKPTGRIPAEARTHWERAGRPQLLSPPRIHRSRGRSPDGAGLPPAPHHPPDRGRRRLTHREPLPAEVRQHRKGARTQAATPEEVAGDRRRFTPAVPRCSAHRRLGRAAGGRDLRARSGQRRPPGGMRHRAPIICDTSTARGSTSESPSRQGLPDRVPAAVSDPGGVQAHGRFHRP